MLPSSPRSGPSSAAAAAGADAELDPSLTVLDREPQVAGRPAARKNPTGPPLIGKGMPHEFSEAFRGIRTNVLFSSTDAGSKSIVVTSTGPGEGKSVVSANLAMSLALARQRVLLIDADMRRPKSHEFFGVSQEPGLSNVMVGDAKASNAVKRTLTPNTCG